MIDPNAFWDDNYYNHPALTEEMIEIAQARLNIGLPISFLEILKIQNGGYTKEFAHPMSEPTSWARDHVSLDHLFGIVVDPTHVSAHNLLDTPYMTKEWGLPGRLALLAGNGHWWIALDYRNGEMPSVVWIDSEVDQDIQIAPSFDVFLEGLVAQSEFEFDD